MLSSIEAVSGGGSGGTWAGAAVGTADEPPIEWGAHPLDHVLQVRMMSTPVEVNATCRTHSRSQHGLTSSGHPLDHVLQLVRHVMLKDEETSLHCHVSRPQRALSTN